MADKEQSIKDQIAAMEGWAIKVRNEAKNKNYKRVEEFLRDINTQGRRLEWRGSGIKTFPDRFAKDLKTQISSARASAEKIMNILDKKDFEQKKGLYLKLCQQYADSMTEMLKRANAIMRTEPWKPENFQNVKTEKWFASVFEQFAQRRGYYKDYHGSYFLEKVNLSGALLVKANLKRANLKGVNLQGANFENANLSEANLNGADLNGANLKGADLSSASLWMAVLEKANLNEADLREADLSGANGNGANLEEANLLRATLRGVKFEKAHFERAVLRKANLERANLERANLQGANFENANLSGANLEGADLKYANLRGAIISGANFTGVINLTPDQLSFAMGSVLARGVPFKF